MSYVHCLMLIIFSVVSGSEENSWREEIEKRLSYLEESNIHLQKQNEELKAIVLDAQHQNKLLKSELEDLGERVNKCEGLNHRQSVKTERVLQKIKSKVKANDDSVTVYNGRNQPVPRIVPPDSYPVSAVAFYGYMSKSSAHNLSVHHLIVYDLVLINKGNGYNKGDGIFIAPVTGVYAFHFSVCVIPGSESPWATLELTRNGNAIGSTFEESKNSGYGSYHCSSTLVISDVDVGDHIFIRTYQPTRGPIYSEGAGRTSFSGWLLFR